MHIHTHCQILPFNKTCADVLRIGISENRFFFAAGAFCGTVAFLAFRIVAVNLDKLSIIDRPTESIHNRSQIRFQAVRGQLNAIGKTRRHVRNKQESGSRITAVRAQAGRLFFTFRDPDGNLLMVSG